MLEINIFDIAQTFHKHLLILWHAIMALFKHSEIKVTSKHH